MKEFNDFLSLLTDFITGTIQVSHPIRLHTRKLEVFGDLSFNSEGCKSVKASKQVQEHHLIDLLVAESGKWPISISRCAITKDVTCIFINRVVCLQCCIPNIICENNRYGALPLDFKGPIVVSNGFEYEDVMCLSLTKLRAVLLKDAIVRILMFNKCVVNMPESKCSKHLKVSVNHTSGDETIVSGHVTLGKISNNSIAVSAAEFYR